MDITRIEQLIRSGELFRHPVLLDSMARGRQRRLHLMGLLSDGGVHSLQDHLYALLRMARQNAVTQVFVHAFMDGRDTPPNSGLVYMEQLQREMLKIGVGEVATLTGRYYAMDRDKRWERTARAYNALLHGEGHKTADPAAAIRASYANGVTDEFIEPHVVVNGRGEPVGLIRDEDAVIFFNFRADRARQLTAALTDPLLEGLPRESMPKNLAFVCMTQYDKKSNLPRVLDPEEPKHILAHIMAEHGMRNLRVAETEKYAHVTYFFNGGVETAFPGEDRILIPSPKVATYDLKPEMSAPEVAETVVKAIESKTFDFMVVNFANADMVGHSGKLEAAIKAVEAVDACLGRIYAALRREGGGMIVTADHGNAEMMIDPVTGGPHTYHTTLPVPLLTVLPGPNLAQLRPGGSLRDIAPTLLGISGLEYPKEMTGRDLRIFLPHA
jgi:2,3-bisphosphoglycerate-independent phosphoglycerate mutase